MKYDIRSKRSLILQRYFYRVLLAELIKRHRKLLQSIKSKRKIDSYLSPAQTDFLLSSYKNGNWKNLGQVSLDTVHYDENVEQALIAAIVQNAAEADLTIEAKHIGDDNSKKISSLNGFESLLFRPGIHVEVDLKTICKQLDLSCQRSIWATAFRCIKQHLSDDYLSYLAPCAATQQIHEHAQLGKIGGMNPLDYVEYMKSVSKRYKEILYEQLSRCKSIPNDPKEAFRIAHELVHDAKGINLPEDYLLACADIAIQNVIQFAKNHDVDIDEKHWRNQDHNSVLLDACNEHSEWVFEPISNLLNEIGYTIYMPIFIEPPEVLNCNELSTRHISTIPKKVAKSPLINLIFQRYNTTHPSAVAVAVKSVSVHSAVNSARNKVRYLLESIAIMYPMIRVNHRFDPLTFMAIDENGYISSSSSRADMLPQINASIEDVHRNVNILNRLRDSTHSWVCQLARCASLIKMTTESDDLEVKFINAWRALESVCGHLTGTIELKCRNVSFFFRKAQRWISRKWIGTTQVSPAFSSRNFIVLAVSCAFARISRSNVDTARSDFTREYRVIWGNLNLIMEIRNTWAIHTGDERVSALENVTDESLRKACDYLIQEIVYPAFRYLSSLALGHPGLETRKDAYDYLFKRIFDDREKNK